MARGARFAGHPLHPAVVHFPVALWSISLVWDALAAWTGAATWWHAGFWCLAAGLVMALPAAATGFMEFITIEDAHPAAATATQHMLVMLCAVCVYAVALVIRAGPAAPEGWRLVAVLLLSASGLVLLAVGGWLGGKMVYRYGVGRSDSPLPENGG